MLLPRVAIRYAKSLLELAVELKTEDAVLADMRMVRDLCKEHREFSIMLSSPVIKGDAKQRMFDKIFEGQLDKTSQKFFEIIIRKNREELIADITQAYIDQYKEFKNIHTVFVETAAPLNDDNRAEIMAFLKTRTDEEIELREVVKEELIGGIVLRMKDEQLDASVRTNLAKLEREFSKDLYTIKY